jgi:2',5'-phosphodiesterase
MPSHRVVQYNILSSHLADPDYFCNCDPKALESDNRFSQICKILAEEINLRSIICLQEVSTDWLGKLHPFFVKYNYYLISSTYGDKSCGYMGVVIAVSLESYEIEGVSINRVADFKSSPQTEPPPNVIWDSLANCFRAAFNSDLFLVTPSTWAMAQSQPHSMIVIQVRCRFSNSPFCVGTYHMPCEYRFPQVMIIHCSLAAQHIQRLSCGLPYVLAGDFNIQPQSTMYRLLTEGSVEAGNPDLPPVDEGDSWRAEVEPMRSAYREAQGSEPDFTNFAQVKNEEPFVDTLDYIFLSKQWEVRAVEPLPHRDEVKGPLPNGHEPSDHVKLAVQLYLP